MEEVRVSNEILQQMKARQVALSGMNVLCQMAQREYNLYLMEQLKELGLESEKRYNINNETGIVSEVREEPVKKNDGNQSEKN